MYGIYPEFLNGKLALLQHLNEFPCLFWEERYVSYDIHDTIIVTFYKELGLSLQLQQLL